MRVIVIPLKDFTNFLVFQMGFALLRPTTVCGRPLFNFFKSVQEAKIRDFIRAPKTIVVHCKERNRSVTDKLVPIFLLTRK